MSQSNGSASSFSTKSLATGGFGVGVLASVALQYLIRKQTTGADATATGEVEQARARVVRYGHALPSRVPDVLKASDSTENQAVSLLQALEKGELSISDLLGPLHGDTGGRMPQVRVPPGTQNKVPTAHHYPVAPMDSHNQRLVDGVHPEEYKNPAPIDEYDLVVIGAGVAGLLSVIMGNALGLKCALIERQYMGGDCLNVGCFPSKVLLHSARVIAEVKRAHKAHVHVDGTVKVDFPSVMERVRRLRADIGSTHDSVARYARDFCHHVFLGEASFQASGAGAGQRGGVILVKSKLHGDVTCRFRKAMIATGTSASIPPPLRDVPHLTNGNIFNLEALPPRIAVVGAGPIGLEMTQAFQRLGAQLTVFEMGPQLLLREDPDAAAVVQKALEEEGVKFYFNVKVTEVVQAREGNLTKAPFPLYNVTVADKDGKDSTFLCEAVINATGRVPNVFDIGLDGVGVKWCNRRGVHVDDFFQTANPDIFACGDVASPFQFTHSADFQARLAIRNMFLGDRARMSDLLIPWCTYTDPEIAHVGLYERDCTERKIGFRVLKRDLDQVDRCKADGIEAGFVKIIIEAESDVILGATIVGPGAGDLISHVTVCMQNGIGVGLIAGTIHPYPTKAEAIRQCAAQYNKDYRAPPAVNIAIKRLLERIV